MKIQHPGALRRRLTIEEPVRATDDAAAGIVAWHTVGELWAAIIARIGREIVTADAQAARITHEVEMRWRDDLTAAMRLRDGARVYVIHALFDRDPQRRRLVALVEELAP